MPVMKEILKIVSKGFDMHAFRILRAITEMLKGPIALLIFSLTYHHGGRPTLLELRYFVELSYP